VGEKEKEQIKGSRRWRDKRRKSIRNRTTEKGSDTEQPQKKGEKSGQDRLRTFIGREEAIH